MTTQRLHAMLRRLIALDACAQSGTPLQRSVAIQEATMLRTRLHGGLIK